MRNICAYMHIYGHQRTDIYRRVFDACMHTYIRTYGHEHMRAHKQMSTCGHMYTHAYLPSRGHLYIHYTCAHADKRTHAGIYTDMRTLHHAGTYTYTTHARTQTSEHMRAYVETCILAITRAPIHILIHAHVHIHVHAVA